MRARTSGSSCARGLVAAESVRRAALQASMLAPLAVCRVSCVLSTYSKVRELFLTFSFNFYKVPSRCRARST
eukprot:scaffold176761_cov31-Tisochrysis_lutea.AAC.1